MTIYSQLVSISPEIILILQNMLIYALFIDCRESHLCTFCHQIHQCASASVLPSLLPFPRAENEISALFQEKGRDFILRLGGGRILLKAIKTAIENIHCVLMPFFITAHVGVHPHNFCILGHALGA